MAWFGKFSNSRHDQRQFTVYINEGEKYQIEKWVERYPNIETGGDLFGAWIDDRTAVVQFVLGPGKYCRRTGTSFFQDIDYLREADTYLTNKHGLCNIGQWHSHHRLGLTRPSGGDENTVWGNMPKLGLDRYIVFIATITGGLRSYYNLNYGSSYSHEEESTVKINPYLFEIKDGRRNGVQHGSFQFMERNSPFRLDKSIRKIVEIGAETMDDVKIYRERPCEYESVEVTTKTPKMKLEAVQHNRAQSLPPNRENFDNDDKGIPNEDEESRQSNIQQGGGTDRNLEDVSNEDEESGQSDIQGDGGTERNLEDVPNEKKENLTDIVSDKSSTSDDGIGQEQDRSQNNLAKGKCFETHENDKDQAIADGHKIAGDNFRDSQSEKSSVPQGDDSYLQTECDWNKKSEPTTPTSHEDECNEKQAEQRDAVIENPNTNSITISNTSGDAQLQAETVENVAKICEGISYLNLASVSIKECGYEMALTWYENALDIFRKLNDIHLQEKALTGLALSQFNLGKNKKAMESIKEAQKLPKDKCNTDACEAKITNENKNSIEQGFSMAGPAESREETNNPCKFATIQESETVTVEWVNSVVEEACNPSRSERLGNEDLVCLEKYIKEFSTKCVYTHPASSKEPFTEKVRKSMTTNVKSLAYDNLLSQNKDKYGSKGNFVNEDQQIFNFAKADVRKNALTKKPAKLHKPLSTYIDAIGQISCGGIQGTCWLVTDKLVITNHHVYVMMNSEKVEKKNPNLPITVSFDYFNDEINESVVTVEVDEEQDPNLENPNLDYKFLRLKEHERLRDRDPLGPIVRSRQLQDGLVIIIGHPAEREMQEETCVVVSDHSWREKLKQRHEEFQQRKEEVQVSPGVHMTNEGLLRSAEKYKDCLPYDTSLFFGSSGSPVFDLKGNIVAMHTQGYTLDVEGRKCSLMEFGVQFRAICEDLKRYENLLEKLFPYYNLKNGEEQIPTERMDIDDSY